jgi:hypothetical protein
VEARMEKGELFVVLGDEREAVTREALEAGTVRFQVKGGPACEPREAPSGEGEPCTAETIDVAIQPRMSLPFVGRGALIEKLTQALDSDELKTTWASLGADPPNLYGDSFGRFVSNEVLRWAEVVKTSGAKLD